MTRFEQVLIGKGYVMHVMNCKTMKLEIPNRHIISTMINLDHRYIHPNKDEVVVFGLHQKGGPATLISPRPRIKVRRTIEDEGWEMDESHDDNMNVVLQQVDHEIIYKAMFDKSIVIDINLIEND